MQKKKSEIEELKDQLNGQDLKQKKLGLRKIIDAMTRGKDVSMLFADIVKNSMTSDMELKKLIYLYIINYSKSHPDLAILAINTFRKDARDKMNPFLRALAVRTMGCIRVRQITEYLIDPLKFALKDEDSYVRKTAVICVAKLYDSAPDLIEEQGFIKILQQMLMDGNVFVLQNTLVALQSISEAKGENLLQLNQSLVQKLLTAIGDCQEWGQVYVLDSLSSYQPQDSSETENILERVIACLSHNNSGVVLSCIKVVMKYLDFISSPEVVRSYCRKITAPLVTMLGAEYEIQYVVLKNINLILQKRQMVFDRELKIFYCNFNDPIYIKREKLDILVRLANMDNFQSILLELKEYTNEVDVDFVKKSIFKKFIIIKGINCIGRCAIKLEKAAEKCVTVLWEFLKQKKSYIIQETIIVMRDIFRKYPKKYEGVLQDLCENFNNLDDSFAKSAMIWIIGEYAEIIDNSEMLLEGFLENFKEESSQVQLQLLTSTVKLFLQRPDDSQSLLKRVLMTVTEESENADLRDRGYFYWRLLHKDPEAARQIVLAERPVISDQSYTLDSGLLDKLIEEIGTLSSVYYKQPEAFVKQLRDLQNLKEIQEIQEQGDDQLLSDKNYDHYSSQEQTQTQNQTQAQTQPQTQTQQNPLTKSVNLLVDLMDNPAQEVQPQVQQNKNVRIPFIVKILNKKVVQQSNQPGVNNKVTGVQIEASVQKINNKIVLELQITNQTQTVLNDFQIKINPNNTFNLSPMGHDIPSKGIAPSSSCLLSKELVWPETARQGFNYPLKLQIALKTSIDIFTFVVPVSLSCFILPSVAIQPQEYIQQQQQCKERKQDGLQCSLNSSDISKRFQSSGMAQVGIRTNPQGVELISYSVKLINNEMFYLDTILDTQNRVLRLNMAGNDPLIFQLIVQAVGFILS